MLREVIDAIVEEISVGQCRRDVVRFWTYRSTVPGPGLRAASHFLAGCYRREGLEADVLPYPADDRTEWVGGRKNSLEWVPRSARLDIVEPDEKARMVCSTAHEPLCLVSNSAATPSGGITAPVIIVQGGDRDEDYDGLDVAGAIILVDTPARNVDALARKRGAAGIVSDCVYLPWMLTDYPPAREPQDTPDLVMWDILSGKRNETPLWAFSLSPRQGDRLRRTIRESESPVLLRACVDADLVEGTSEVVSAVLPGTDLAHEEVWLLAHSSEPGAEDNASGCCLAVEVARTLCSLVERGLLPPPRRTIRFLHGVEVTGYLPYLDARGDDLDGVVAGLCFDAVGQDFSLVRGEFIASRCPETNASGADALFEHIFAAVATEHVHRFSPDTYAMFPWHTSPFLGNDSFICDGFFDVPTPEMSTWPERFYHSCQDTPDTLSDNTLARAGTIAAAYLYFIANAGPDEAMWVAGLTAAEWRQRIAKAVSARALNTSGEAAGRSRRLRALACHLGYQASDAVEWVLRLALDDGRVAAAVDAMAEDLADFAEREGERAAALAVVLEAEMPGDTLLQAAEPSPDWVGERVPRRLRWDVPEDGSLSSAARSKLQVLASSGGDVTRAWEWINGRRSLERIWERLQYGGLVEREALAGYVEMLVNEGCVRWA
jgi:uncharacterized protein DUF4910